LERKLAKIPVKNHFLDYNGDPTNVGEVKHIFACDFWLILSGQAQLLFLYCILGKMRHPALTLVSIDQQCCAQESIQDSSPRLKGDSGFAQENNQ
jgi:hypothetical protein